MIEREKKGDQIRISAVIGRSQIKVESDVTQTSDTLLLPGITNDTAVAYR